MKHQHQHKHQLTQERIRLDTPLILVSLTHSGISDASTRCTVADLLGMVEPDGCELMPLEYRVNQALDTLARENGLKALYAKRGE